MTLRFGLALVLSLSLAAPALAGAPATGSRAVKTSKPAPVPKGWAKTLSADGGYSLVFPGTAEARKLTHEDGTFLANMYVLELDEGNVAFMSSHSDIPKDRMSVAPDTILEDAKQGALANTSGTLESEKRISVDGNAGRELVISTPGGMRTYVRIVLAKGRLFQAMAVMPREHGAKKDVRGFLDSFRLEKR